MKIFINKIMKKYEIPIIELCLLRVYTIMLSYTPSDLALYIANE